MTVRLKSSTSAACVLIIDSSSTRGIISLGNLETLQRISGPKPPLCDMVDLMVCYSSSGLIALSKFMLRLDAEI